MIIAIASATGPSSGKDEVAKMFLEEKDFFTYDAFASPLKKIVAILLDVSEEMLYDTEFKKKDLPENLKTDKVKTVRDFLVYIGTTLFRDNYKTDIWAQAFATRYKTNKHVVISDIRFLNELEIIKKIDSEVILIAVNRPGNEITGFEAEKECVELCKEADFIITNEGTLDQLHSKARTLVRHIIHGVL